MSDSQNPLDALAEKVNAYKQTGVSDAVQKPLEKFVEKLIDQKGFVGLTPEVRTELRNDLLFRLDDFIAARSIAALSDEHVVIFEKLLEEQKPEGQIQQFLVDHIPEYQVFIANVLLEFQGVYLGTIPVPPSTAQDASSASEEIMAMPPPPPPAPVRN